MNFRTDLALEAAEPHQNDLPRGIISNEYSYQNLSINHVSIKDTEAAELINKPVGEYITIIVPPFSSTVELSENEIEKISTEIKSLLPQSGLVLVVGLGNNDITPDAIGPRCANQILATRHITDEIAKQNGLDKLRPTAVIAPGVLGQTGVETSEIIASLVGDLKPEALIVIDALAARSTGRLGNTIQIASSGISPGSGVMNARKALSQETLGVPVISIGVPTVVDATTLASDLFAADDDYSDEVRQLFEPDGNSMMITPREIDNIISRACKTVSLAINKALQSDMSFEEIGYLVG